MNYKNRILVVADASNFEYLCIHAAVKKWETDCNDESSLILKETEDTDQSNLPKLLNYTSFRRVLKNVVIKKLNNITWIVKNNHQEEADIAQAIDIVLTEDDKLDNNFRKLKYPEYKAQRKLQPKRFDDRSIKDYIRNVIFEELEIEKNYGYRLIKVKDCESDDIIAVIMKNFKDYMCRILISNDHDFLQLENVNQYTWWGEKVKRILKNINEDNEMNEKDFLLWKIIRGDLSDNIKSVFSKFGDKKSYNLINDKPRLKQMLMENNESAKKFMLNKSLIDFNQIPKDIEERIINEVNDKFSTFGEISEFNVDDL